MTITDKTQQALIYSLLNHSNYGSLQIYDKFYIDNDANKREAKDLKAPIFEVLSYNIANKALEFKSSMPFYKYVSQKALSDRVCRIFNLNRNSYENSPINRDKLIKACNINIKSRGTGEAYMSKHVDKATNTVYERPNVAFWSMPIDLLNCLDTNTSKKLIFPLALRHPDIFRVEGLTLPNKQVCYFLSKPSGIIVNDDDSITWRENKLEDFTSRYFSAITQWKKDFRRAILHFCSEEFFEVDINSCASQVVAHSIKDTRMRLSILSKIGRNKFYAYDETDSSVRKQAKQQMNKLIFSQISDKANCQLKYKDNKETKEMLIKHIVENTTLDNKQAAGFLKALVLIVEKGFAGNGKAAYGYLLHFEEYMKLFQDRNAEIVDGVRVTHDILRVHDCLYIRGKQKTKELIEFLRKDNILFKVEKIVLENEELISKDCTSEIRLKKVPSKTFKQVFDLKYLTTWKENGLLKSRGVGTY